MEETKRVRIKAGSTIAQHHHVSDWPNTKAGDVVDHGMEFDAEWTGTFWECRANGYGRRSWKGEDGRYGNGSIFAFGEDSVEVLE